MALIITLGVIPTNYDIIVPAGISNVNKTYQFENFSGDDVNVYSVAVYEYYNISILDYVIAKLNPYKELTKHNDYVNTSYTYAYNSGTIQRDVSLNNALISGYNATSYHLEYEFKGDIIHSIYGKEKSNFEIGDIIIKFEDEIITIDHNINYLIYSKYGSYEKNGVSYINIELDKPYHFTVLRKGQEVEVTTYAFMYDFEDVSIPILGISCYNYYEINKNSAEINYYINKPYSYGPSAGLMQALYIYDTLSKEGLTKNKKIVGTGTIDENGKVGAIGGVGMKLISAYLAGANYFFVPVDNYDEAYQTYAKLHTKMELVKVSSLDDVINYLRGVK